ncbi:MAG: NTP transferase domain-containing protein, partial [Holophagales bacterium]|nr:NTP transferase domain-containing protein [Holophagales bacterium]
MRTELLVMAAGMGSRFGGLKQLEPVGPCGEKVMDYSLYDAKRAGVERVVFVIRREFESDFHQQVGSRFAKWMDVAYAFQEIDLLPEGFFVPEGRVKPWGTAHAILAAKDTIKKPFIAINADDFYGRRAFSVLADWLSGPAQPGPEQYAMVAFQMANTLSANGTVARGVCEVNENGLRKAVEEHTALEPFESGVRDVKSDGSVIKFTGLEPVSMNFWGFRPSIFLHLEELFIDFLKERGQELKSEFYIPFAVDDFIRTGRATVQVLHTPDQ